MRLTVILCVALFGVTGVTSAMPFKEALLVWAFFALILYICLQHFIDEAAIDTEEKCPVCGAPFGAPCVHPATKEVLKFNHSNTQGE